MASGGTDLLILKLTIVPLALLAFGIVERRHGRALRAGCRVFRSWAFRFCSSLPWIRGQAFGSAAALGAYFGLMPWLAFTMSYAYLAQRLNWVWCILLSFAIWTSLAFAAVALQSAPRWLEIFPLIAFLGVVLFTPARAPFR
jgi:hypothetical protein